MKDSMMLITSTWEVGGNPVPTFKMIPIAECPYSECIYDPGSGALAIISKVPMEKFVMVPKLDAGGQRLPIYEGNGANRKLAGFKQERALVNSYQEYYIEKEDEITRFINMFAQNANIFSYQPFYKKPLPPGDVTLPDSTKHEMSIVREDA